MNGFEEQQVDSLRSHGYALAPTFLSGGIDRTDFCACVRTCSAIFRSTSARYSVQMGQRASLGRLSYAEIAATEKMIALARSADSHS